MLDFKEPILEKVLRSIRVSKVIDHIKYNTIVCDIGCGQDIYFLRKARGKIKRGFGIDKESINYNDKKITIIKDKLTESLPFPDNKFDAVTLIAVLEHLDFPKKIIKEIYRILKPNGILILTTPAPYAHRLIDFLASRLKLLSREQINDHKHYWSKEELMGLFRKCKYSDIKYKYFELRMNSLVLAKK